MEAPGHGASAVSCTAEKSLGAREPGSRAYQARAKNVSKVLEKWPDSLPVFMAAARPAPENSKSSTRAHTAGSPRGARSARPPEPVRDRAIALRASSRSEIAVGREFWGQFIAEI